MLTKNEMRFMNQPIWSRQGHCVGYRKLVLKDVVVELVLESVHPANLGALPVAPDMIAWKAVQIGLIESMAEAYEYRRCGQFN